MMTIDSPYVVFGISFIVLVLSMRLGIMLQRVNQERTEGSYSDLSMITTSALTLLALLISFTFSMATSRFDLRGNLEVEEAGDIRTEYLRADLLPPNNAAQIKAVLKSYVDRRVDFYNDNDAGELEKLSSTTDQLRDQLWDVVRVPAVAAPSAISALPVAGADSMFKTRRETDAAWADRIPPTAEILLLIIAACSTLLAGLGARSPKSRLHAVLPLLISIAFFLISDIENPRAGIIRISPSDLSAASAAMRNR